MPQWSTVQNEHLTKLYKEGQIDPQNLDPKYLYSSTVRHFQEFVPDKTKTTRNKVVARLRKKSREWVFSGTLKGR
jgi:hypothetical protein